MLRLIGVALLALPIGSSIILAEDLKLPPLQKQSTPPIFSADHIPTISAEFASA